MKLTQGTGMGTCWWINIIVFFNKISLLRKENIFIKSRYSRNRQWCRPIVIFTLLLNFLTVITTLTLFYKLKINYAKLAWVVLISGTVYSLKNGVYVLHKIKQYM